MSPVLQVGARLTPRVTSWHPRFAGLWRHGDFLRLWAGQTISEFGAQIALLALPLTAVLVLAATPVQMGLLNAASSAPWLLFGLVAGVWVDRLPRRSILIGSDFGRAVLLGSIPLAALLGLLHMEYLYVVAFCAGVLTVLFTVAYQAFLPSLVRREQLVEANSRLTASATVASNAGPGLAGGLIQLVAAPVAVAIYATSFLVSPLLVRSIRLREAAPASHTQRRSMTSELREGLRVVLKNPLLRSLAASSGTQNFFTEAIMAVYVLYVTRELGVEPAVLGVIFALGSAGSLLSAALAERLTRHLGLGLTVVQASLLQGGANLCLVLAASLPGLAIPLLAVRHVLRGFALQLNNINTVSLRQAITPDRLQGRVNASVRVMTFGAKPLGALLGGALGEAIGLQATVVVGALGIWLSAVWLLLASVHRVREAPAPMADRVAAA